MTASPKKTFRWSVIWVALLSVATVVQLRGQNQTTEKPKLYNTAKQKLLEGKHIAGFTQSKFDIAGYCETAKHYDYTWFEMQHSTLEFKDVEAMIAACPHVAATPMLRVPDAQEWHIQHATDIGVLGVIVPTVDDLDRARDAAKWSRYPPVGRRSVGLSQAPGIWGTNGASYRQTINDNMLVVVMIETPTGAANAFDIASVPGVDVVMIGNGDLSSFSGYPATDEHYQALVQKIHDDTLKAGKIFGQAAISSFAKDTLYLYNGPPNDGWVPPKRAGGGVN